MVITASQDSFSGTAHIEVIGYDDCCQAAIDEGVDNFCDIPADNTSCTIAAQGGVCDPNDDGEIDEDERAAGATLFADQCETPTDWEPELMCKARAPHNTESCDDIYDPTIDYWRCVTWENSPADPDGWLASQVCRDPDGTGAKWLTMNLYLEPESCCACHGQERNRGDIPSECCAPGVDCTVPTAASPYWF